MMKRLQDIPPETPQVPHEYLLVYSRRHGHVSVGSFGEIALLEIVPVVPKR